MPGIQGKDRILWNGLAFAENLENFPSIEVTWQSLFGGRCLLFFQHFVYTYFRGRIAD